MLPWLPQVGSVAATDDQDRRLLFARWLVDVNNPYFAPNRSQSYFRQLFSRGIVRYR